MAVLEKFIAEAPPLHTDMTGTVRVAGTRVTLDTIIARYHKSESPAAIARAFDALTEEEVYAVLAYYLRHRQEMDAYLTERARKASLLRNQSKSFLSAQELRDRLATRISKGKS